MRPSILLALLPLAAACSSTPERPSIPDASVNSAQPSTSPAVAPAAPTAGVPPVAGLHLQALVATSGDFVENLLDGDPTTGWSPAADPVDNGVLLRFEEPTRVLQAQLQLCPESSSATFQTFVNGAENTLVRINPGGPVLLPWRGGADTPALKSLFVRVLGSDGPVEVCEIALTLPPENPQAVKPPRAVSATIQASSVLEPADAYHPGYLFDGRTDFGWVEGADGLGVGESLTVQFAAPVQVTGLDLWNGYQRSADHFAKNARLATLELAVDGGTPQTIPVADVSGMQQLSLPTPVTGQRFVLTVAAATPGSKYQDLVISELRLRDVAGPFTLDTPDLAEREQALMDHIQGTDLDRIVDRVWRGLCNEGVRLSLRSNHSFVSYRQLDDPMEDDVREIFDGAWVVKALGEPNSIQLFGRAHRAETTWVPYGDVQVQTTERIAGGTSTLWLHGPAHQARSAQLMGDRTFADEHSYCQPDGAAWLAKDPGDVLFINGTSLAGVYIPF